MIRQAFTYSRLKIILIWMLVLSAPFIWYVPELLEFLKNPYYWIINTLIMCVLVFILWAVMDSLPSTRKTGAYWEEDGITVIEYETHKVCLSDVTEIFLCKHALSYRMGLLIYNNGKKISFLSERHSKYTEIEDTEYYVLFSKILAENPLLIQEKDAYGDPISYWYKRSKS